MLPSVLGAGHRVVGTLAREGLFNVWQARFNVVSPLARMNEPRTMTGWLLNSPKGLGQAWIKLGDPAPPNGYPGQEGYLARLDDDEEATSI